jgi:phospholipase/carboxylesterase
MRAILLAPAVVVATMALAPSRASAQAASATDFAKPGRYDLKIDNVRDGLVYVPSNYKAGTPTPLLVWLHGAGGQGSVSTNLAGLADEFNVIVLAPDSREWTWGAILGRWGPDVEFLQTALKQTIGRYSIDRTRLWLGGFSDGGSFSLSLGISYGDVFRKVFAGAPGIMQPIEANGKPPIFLAHGRQDQTMPIDETSRKFRPKLEALGYDVTYREYDGRHQLPPEVLREAFEWFAK